MHNKTRADIDVALQAAASLLERISGLTSAELTGLQRRQLGGTLHSHTPVLVTAIAQALTEHADLFAHLDLKDDGRALRTAQDRADAWRCLRDVFCLCAEQAGDAYLLEQAGAQARAGAILKRVLAEVDFGQKWGRPLDRALDRLLALCPATTLINDLQRRRQSTTRARRLRAARGR